MFKKSTLLVAAGLGLVSLASTAVQAAPASSTDKPWEIQLAGSGSNDKNFENGGFDVNATVGYYFNDQWQVNVRQGAGYSDFGGGSSWTGATRVGVDYHFDYNQDQRVIPFVGVELGYVYGDQTNDTWAAGPEAGLKWYVNDTTFIYGSVLYEFLFDGGSDVDSNFGNGQFVYNLGVGFRF